MLEKLRRSLSKIVFLTSLRDFLLSLFYPLFQYRHRIPSYTVHSIVESSRDVSQNNISLSRYGDGELRWLLGVPVTHSFQKNDETLSNRLSEVFKSRDISNFAISLPELPNKGSGYKFSEQVAWRAFWVRYGMQLMPLIDPNYIYQNAFITRPYMAYKLKHQNEATEVFDNLKQSWNGKVVLIIEGKFTRFGIEDNLLSNAGDVKRIICPDVNAFEAYKSIYDAAVESFQMFDLDKLIVLIALGPTATVLCYDLAKLGVQAVDIGHADIEYSWYQSGAQKKVNVKGKYVNEAKDPFVGELDQNDERLYNRQIIKTI